MQRSDKQFITTHVGSLPSLVPLDESAADYNATLRDAVGQVVKKQRDIGLDVVNEGEYTKGGDWLSFVESRFNGFEARDWPEGEKPLLARGKDREDFAAYYQYATEKGLLFYNPGEQIQHAKRKIWVCTEPVSYSGADELAREIEITKQAAGTENVFLTSTAPASIEPYRRNEYYKSEEEFLFAIADALAVEYRTITDSGLILQVDDAWLPALWDRIGMDMGMEAFRKRCALRMEALNHALKGIPEEQVRYHLCWGSWHGPHAYDLDLKHIVDLMLSVNAQAYLIEGANARHEHEWQVWEDVKLPEGKVLIPGVIGHATETIEHPELVAQRIGRYAEQVGRENVIAGADCGFGGRSHPQIAWAKLQALVDGTRIASKKYFG
ncbi:MAG: cobalamin-independent methionine synthase II family protein [Hyphomicrobiales bacterium]|nr:cobalamin-independent methionine synthase II family protein [Hyphomicrobiales bacterium]